VKIRLDARGNRGAIKDTLARFTQSITKDPRGIDAKAGKKTPPPVSLPSDLGLCGFQEALTALPTRTEPGFIPCVFIANSPPISSSRGGAVV
jgi:hypothetical protein